MVPSGPIAGAVLTGGRCEPQVTLTGAATLPSAFRTGHGSAVLSYRQGHCAVAAGIALPSVSLPRTSDDQGTAVGTPAAVTLTSQEFGTSTSHGSLAVPSSCITL